MFKGDFNDRWEMLRRWVEGVFINYLTVRDVNENTNVGVPRRDRGDREKGNVSLSLAFSR